MLLSSVPPLVHFEGNPSISSDAEKVHDSAIVPLLVILIFGSDIKVHVRLTHLCIVGFLLFSLRIGLGLNAVHRIFLLVLQIDYLLIDLVYIGFLRDFYFFFC